MSRVRVLAGYVPDFSMPRMPFGMVTEGATTPWAWARLPGLHTPDGSMYHRFPGGGHFFTLEGWHHLGTGGHCLTSERRSQSTSGGALRSGREP